MVLQKTMAVKVVQVFRVALAQALLREQLRVGAQLRVPQAALLAHVEDRGHRGGNGVVLETLRLANHQHVLQVDRLGMRRRRQRRTSGRLRVSRETSSEERKRKQNREEETEES